MSEEKGFRYLLAQDNATYYWTWSVMVVTWIYYFLFLKNRKMLWYCIFYSASTIASYFVTWSVTPMIATLLLGLLVLLYRRRVVHGGFLNKIRLESLLGRFNLYWIVALLFNYLMAVVHIYQRFERLIRHYLKKSVTLSGRTAIWDKSIVYFKKAPLIGYGQEARAVTIPRIGFNHTHNIILEILYRGGIIGGVLFLILLIHLGIKSRKINNIVYDFLMLSIFIFLCVTVADFAFYRYTYLIIFLLLEHSEIFANAEARTSFVREKRLRLS